MLPWPNSLPCICFWAGPFSRISLVLHTRLPGKKTPESQACDSDEGIAAAELEDKQQAVSEMVWERVAECRVLVPCRGVGLEKKADVSSEPDTAQQVAVQVNCNGHASPQADADDGSGDTDVVMMPDVNGHTGKLQYLATPRPNTASWTAVTWFLRSLWIFRLVCYIIWIRFSLLLQKKLSPRSWTLLRSSMLGSRKSAPSASMSTARTCPQAR